MFDLEFRPATHGFVVVRQSWMFIHSFLTPRIRGLRTRSFRKILLANGLGVERAGEFDGVDAVDKVVESAIAGHRAWRVSLGLAVVHQAIMMPSNEWHCYF